MSFLYSIKKYASKYQSELKKYNYKMIDTIDGPGMGASIKYTNDSFIINLINDRDEYFIDIEIRNKVYPLSVLLAIGQFTDNGCNILKLTKRDKEAMWAINYDYKDPFKSLFDNYEKILRISQKNNSDLLDLQAAEYYKDRGEWLFPKPK